MSPIKNVSNSFRYYLYIAFAIIFLVTGWESKVSNAAFIEPVIPHESIRLRILANSNDPGDQWVKRKVRDVVIKQMNTWVTGPTTLDEARATVRTHLPELNKLVGKVLKKHHFDYDYTVELAVVPFPDKIYGNKVYPAGDYEALRIVLGKGKGHNWWCVLFPPLCFVDLKKADAEDKAEVAKERKQERGASAQGGRRISAAAGVTASVKSGTVVKTADTSAASGTTKTAPKKHFRFFLWDLLMKLFAFLKHLFS